MATIVLSAAGMALGGAAGGAVFGLSSAAIGRAAGATLGRLIDQRLMGAGSDAVEVGQIDRFRLAGAGEGAPIGQVYGRMRVAGQVIWATEFLETTVTTGGGKGAPRQPTTTHHSYSVSLAVALCEGEISRIARVWADGEEIETDDLAMRVYNGAEDQLPDPKIEAVEGADNTPAYRGLAYVVFEDLPLGRFGNRVPQFSFEVMRPEQSDAVEEGLSRAVRAVAMIPGTGEYSLATTPVYLEKGAGRVEAANMNASAAQTDFLVSAQALEEELPNCGSVSLVVSWFGNDLRCGHCQITPKVDQKGADGQGMPWRVSGETRATAGQVTLLDDAPVYGGTPADAAVIEALTDLRARGKSVVFNPFILMDQGPDNALPDPWSGGSGQAAFPWRGRITTSLAAGIEGGPDGTASADQEVADFFGAAQASDFGQEDGVISYSGPQDWGYRRFILHYAHLCAAVGGVDAFLLGSELRGLTQIRGANGFPAVDQLVTLLVDLRAILGPDAKLSYGADWSEYHGYQPVGTADKYFHLDDFWAHPECDFIGIDNYLPLSDWRDGMDHADAEWGSIYDLDYLRANIEGGEYYDWFYHSPEAMEAQIRTPITDGDGEPWVWRSKDMRNWWLNPHHNRVDGERSAYATAWVPESKPIWFTELGCAAIDKATNEPNKFLDPKSSESALPRASNGARDDFMQMQYIRAMTGYYEDEANNPVSQTTGLPMVDVTRSHIWAWDARPYPAYPARADIWADGDNYTRGHWLNGRASSRPLASVVAEICARSGVEPVDVSQLYGLVRGYVVPDMGSARAALQPLSLAYGFDAIERDGTLVFRSRSGRVDDVIDRDRLAIDESEAGALELTRAQAPEIAGRVQLGFVEADGSYETRSTEAVYPGETVQTTARSEMALALTQGEGLRIAERWLSEARIARDGARFDLPPSALHLGPGDVVTLPGDDGTSAGTYRIDVAEQTDRQSLEAVRIEAPVYEAQDGPESRAQIRSFTPPVPVELVMMDLPLLRGDENEIAPHVAASGVPWPGSVALYGSDQDEGGYDLKQLIPRASVIGYSQTELAAAQPGLWDHGAPLRVRLIRGTLSSALELSALNGANTALIGDGTAEGWELFQFTQAELVDVGVYDLSGRLRGQAGSDGIMPDVWPVGSVVVLLDGTPAQIDLSPAVRGIEQHYRYGPAARPLGDPSYRHRVEAFRGVGLRPYRPGHLRADVTAGGVDLNWIRRTRLDGDSWVSGEVPLGEAQEAYAVQIWQAGNLLRETEVTAPGWTYDAQQAQADGASGEVSFGVAQISERFGPGPFAWVSATL